MKKVLYWGAAAFALLLVIGAVAGGAQDESSDDRAVKSTPRAEAEATSEPTPEPTVNVVFNAPTETTSDVVKRRGKVTPAQGKVRVKGAKVIRSGPRWSAQVNLEHGENSFKVSATLPGAKRDRTTAVVTRELTAAEKAAAREAKRQAEAAAREAERQVFIASAQSIPYNQLEKNPRDYKGTKVVMRGQVFQIQEGYGTTWMLLSVTDLGYDFWDDNVWVDYDGEIQGAEGDIVTIYGTVKGAKSYETQIGGETYVPRVKAAYVVE